MSDTQDAVSLPRIREVMEYLPHRFPFLMIDRVVEREPGKRVVCIKNVTANEPQFTGHFPGNPIMPGVLITEALAQACVFAVLDNPREGKTPILTGIDGAKFRRQVIPGDTLRLEIEVQRIKRGFGKCAAKATVEEELAAEMTISFALVDSTEGG